MTPAAFSKSPNDESHGDGQLAEFLIAEYEHVGDAFLRNEEDGERRVQFFLTLATAVAGGLGFLLKREDEPVTQSLANAGSFITIAFTGLLLFGLITFARIIQRNVVTDRYKFALRAIRRCFIGEDLARIMPNAFFELHTRNKPEGRKLLFTSSKVGWSEVVSLVNAFLAGAVVLSLVRPEHGPLQVIMVVGAPRTDRSRAALSRAGAVRRRE